MYGDAWSNPLVYTFSAYNNSVYFEDCYLDLDGAFHEAYIAVGLHVNNCHINMTNYEYGIWNDFRWDCASANLSVFGLQKQAFHRTDFNSGEASRNESRGF